MNKKGLEFKILTVLIFVALLLTFFFGFTGKLGATILGGADKDSRLNFDALVGNIEFMLSKQSSFESQSMILYIEKNHYVFGFMGPQTLSAYGKVPNEYPRKCKGKPCLCLYKKMKKFPSSPLKCKDFDSSVIFHGYFNAEDPVVAKLKVPYQNKALYSAYPEELFPPKYSYLLLSKLGTDDIKDYYVEKFVDNGKTHILVTPGFRQEFHIEPRIALLGTCPGNSMDVCLGKRRNSFINTATKEYCFFEESAQRCVVKDLADCVAGEKVTNDCICGPYVVDTTKERFCIKRSSDNKFFVIPFDCSAVSKCEDYCDEITATAGCDSDETYYCNLDPCGYGDSGVRCKAVESDGKTDCVRPVSL